MHILHNQYHGCWWPRDTRSNDINPIKVGISGPRTLTHWGRDKMAAVSQTTLSSAFLWMKMLEFRLRFHWSLFLRVELTIIQHWFRWWPVAGQATGHYLNQWWSVYWRIYTSLGLNELVVNVFLPKKRYGIIGLESTVIGEGNIFNFVFHVPVDGLTPFWARASVAQRWPRPGPEHMHNRYVDADIGRHLYYSERTACVLYGLILNFL